MGMRAAITRGAAIVATVSTLVVTGTAASAATTPGVTSSTIRVGVPYVDVGSLASLGMHINLGSFPDAYKALFANINAHGGIEGRKIVPFLVAVNPTGATGAASSCRRLTEDDKVFVALRPLRPTCLQTKGVVTIDGNAMFGTATSPPAAPDFTISGSPEAAYVPRQIAALANLGNFKGETVAVFAGASTDRGALQIALAALKKEDVTVVQSAVDGAPAGDLVASNRQVTVISQQFQSTGVNEVVGSERRRR